MSYPNESLLKEVECLYANNDYLKIMSLLDNQDLDYSLALLLARVYVNAYNLRLDYQGRDLLNGANLLLDNFANEGKNDPNYLFVKGYVLFKQGLIGDAKVRFERAITKVNIATVNSQSLLASLNGMIATCNSLQQELNCNLNDLALYERFIQKNFGEGEKIGSYAGVDLIKVNKVYEHDYKLLFTKGLLGKVFDHQESLELVLALPAVINANDEQAALNLLNDLILYVKQSTNYIGFGFYFENQKILSFTGNFAGGMLCALGDFSIEQQSLKLEHGNLNILQVVLLKQNELLYRQRHNAKELLDLFKLRAINPGVSFVERDSVISPKSIESKSV